MSKVAVDRTVGGKFNSTGKAVDQRANTALVTKLVGEIGRDDAIRLPPNDQIFLSDCRIKLNQSGSDSVFGWRQVEKIVAIHKEVLELRKGL